MATRTKEEADDKPPRTARPDRGIRRSPEEAVARSMARYPKIMARLAE